MHTYQFMTCAALVAALSGPQAAAESQSAELMSGTYRCSSYNVSGGGGSCRTMPRLVLDPDGSYRFSSTRGQWSSRKDGQVVLSESRLWGPGTVVAPTTLRFEYDYNGWRHVVTWVCQDCAEARAGAAPGSAAASGAAIGVSLVLDFDAPIGGVSGYTLVPAEAARAYGHNAPMPPGAVQGLAWESARMQVSLATNRNNTLASGKRYVVFLSWPRETLAVAVLDLPSQAADYSATLPATLDGEAVLGRLGR